MVHITETKEFWEGYDQMINYFFKFTNGRNQRAVAMEIIDRMIDWGDPNEDLEYDEKGMILI